MITQTKFYKKYKEEIIQGLISGFLFGLIYGLILEFTQRLIYGLLFGFISGLTIGLAVGLVSGLACGFVWGLAFGLVIMLIHFPEAFPFLVGVYPILGLIIGIIILTEILFLFMKKEKLKKNVNVFWHVCKRKLECLIEVLFGLTFIGYVYIFVREGKKYLTQELINGFIKWVGYVGVGIICLVIIGFIFYFWIKLNSLKYENA